MANPSLLNQVLLRFEDGFKEHREDVSAVQLTPDKHLWLGSDETSTIERLSFIDSQLFLHKQFRVADFIELPAPSDRKLILKDLPTLVTTCGWLVPQLETQTKPDKTDEKIFRD